MILYYVFGLSSLYVSDVYLVQNVSEPLLSQLQAIKGLAEVLLTGVLIFLLTAGSRAPLEYLTDKLERQREELDVLHRVLRHNFRNDLTVLQGMMEASMDTSGPDNPKRRQEQARGVIEDINHYVEQADRIRRITEQNGSLHAFELPELVNEIVENNQHVTDSVTVDVESEQITSTEANHMFPEAIDELVTNAIVHNDAENPKVNISINEEPGPVGHVSITVADNGPGIPGYVVRVLDETNIDQLTHLDGMGLWFVLWTISNSNGELDFETSDAGTAIRMIVRKPLSLTDGGEEVIVGD